VLVAFSVAVGTLQMVTRATGPSTTTAALPVVIPDSTPAPPGSSDVREEAAPKPGPTLALRLAEPGRELVETAPNSLPESLPKNAVDSRLPMALYAASFDRSSALPRIGLLIGGVGMSEAESLNVINNLPSAVTLGISAYASDIGPLLAVARKTGHEYLLSVPMEPLGYPLNDPDNRLALMTSLAPSENLKRLRTMLGRIAGNVGVTGAFGPMNGERLVSAPDQADSMLDELARRGLLFVDSRVGQTGPVQTWNRSIDLVVDGDSMDALALDDRLEALTRMAREKGSALGLVSILRPVTVQRIAAWSRTLAAEGVVLAPVTALVLPPAKQETDR
jgi:polysaccharide deacetylase 2 family uncharacterized protein YibQ